MRQVFFNMKKFLSDAEKNGLALQMNYEEEYFLIEILRHEKNDLYNIRLSNNKNLMSIQSKYIEVLGEDND